MISVPCLFLPAVLATINLQSQSELRQLTAILLGAQVRARSAWVSVGGFSGRGTTGLGLQLSPFPMHGPPRSVLPAPGEGSRVQAGVWRWVPASPRERGPF